SSISKGFYKGVKKSGFGMMLLSLLKNFGTAITVKIIKITKKKLMLKKVLKDIIKIHQQLFIN
ncbi:hypothetical protein, partial [Crocosphaera sp. Alani8]|uniref:hypothetical protein n=1 Tax=Crocosphaera sp. Alani8 TaxID=3038952 RepID=UPI00313B33A9